MKCLWPISWSCCVHVHTAQCETKKIIQLTIQRKRIPIRIYPSNCCDKNFTTNILLWKLLVTYHVTISFVMECKEVSYYSSLSFLTCYRIMPFKNTFLANFYVPYEGRKWGPKMRVENEDQKWEWKMRTKSDQNCGPKMRVENEDQKWPKLWTKNEVQIWGSKMRTKNEDQWGPKLRTKYEDQKWGPKMRTENEDRKWGPKMRTKNEDQK